MAGRFGPNTLIAIVLTLLNIAAFFILLGSAAYLQSKATTVAGLLNQLSSVLTTEDLTPTTIPRRFISYEWFKAVFQILTLLATLGVLVSGQIYRFRLALVGLLAVLMSLWCDSSQTFYYLHIQVDAAESVTGKPIAQATRAFWAGCMISAALNGLLIIVLGSGIGEAHDRTRDNNYPGVHANRNGYEDAGLKNGNAPIASA